MNSKLSTVAFLSGRNIHRYSGMKIADSVHYFVYQCIKRIVWTKEHQ